MKQVILILPLLLLCSCASHYASTSEAYTKSENGKKLKVPAPLTSASISHFYDLPNGKKTTVASIEPPRNQA